VSDANNEVSVLKRKNASSLRELTKELKECQRKLESSHHLRVASPLSVSSRASSNSSLNKLANNELESNSSSSNLSLASSETIANGYVRTNPQIQVNSLPSNVPDSQVLVEKIVKLQRELAKRQEKMDFMEEHVGTMVEEMKKKNKLLQNLMLKQDVGTLATTDMDDNKVIFYE